MHLTYEDLILDFIDCSDIFDLGVENKKASRFDWRILYNNLHILTPAGSCFTGGASRPLHKRLQRAT